MPWDQWQSLAQLTWLERRKKGRKRNDLFKIPMLVSFQQNDRASKVQAADRGSSTKCLISTTGGFSKAFMKPICHWLCAGLEPVRNEVFSRQGLQSVHNPRKTKAMLRAKLSLPLYGRNNTLRHTDKEKKNRLSTFSVVFLSGSREERNWEMDCHVSYADKKHAEHSVTHGLSLL